MIPALGRATRWLADHIPGRRRGEAPEKPSRWRPSDVGRAPLVTADRKPTADDLRTALGWTESEAELVATLRRRSFPAAERARRRARNKRARASRRRNRAA